MSQTQQDLLKSIYYDPKQGLRGIQSLYRAAKNKDTSITLNQVKDYIKKQEVHQVFSQPKFKSYPLASAGPFTRLQMDLLDVSNEIPRMNNQVKFLMCVIDVYSRYGFILPLKSKNENDVINAFKSIIHEIGFKFKVIPDQIDCDNEASFTSRKFISYCKSLGIWLNFSAVGDFKSKGIVERWNRTIRELIAHYRTAYKTNRYIDALPDLVYGYNHSYHSFLQGSPTQAISNPIYHDYGYLKKIDKATEFNRLNIGDKVRVQIKHKQFDKNSSAIKWSITTHKIEKINGTDYFVSGRKHPYKRTELKEIDEIQENPSVQSSFIRQLQGQEIQDTERNLQRHREKQTAKRRLTREGI